MYISCSTVGEEGSIRAESTDKEGNKIKSSFAFLTCVPEGEVWQPKEHLEFSPQNATGKPFEEKAITLWMNANLVKPGDAVILDFTPAEDQQGGKDAIEFEGDVRVEPDGRQTFDFIVEDTEVLPNGYRRKAIKFTGKKDGFGGILKALVKDDGEIKPATCCISIKNVEDDGGMLSDWDAKPVDLDQYVFFENQKVVFNLSVPMVSRVLGSSLEVAKERCKTYEECAMFVGWGIFDTFLEHVLAEAYRSRKRMFRSDSVDGRMREIANEKHKLIKKYGKDVLMKFVPGSRQDVHAEQDRTMTMIGKDGPKKVKVVWTNGIERKDLRPHELDIYPKSVVLQKAYRFRIGQAKFTVAAWEYPAQNHYVIELYDYEKGGKGDAIFYKLQKITQHYRPPEIYPGAVPEGMLYSEVQKIRLDKTGIEKIQLTIDDLNDIPDPPAPNDYGNICEHNSNWILLNRPLVYYEVNENVKKKVESTLAKPRLVCLIRADRPDVMVLQYVRTIIVPVIGRET